MRSFTGPSGITYLRNGDYSGEITVFTDELPTSRNHPGEAVEIPFADMLALVAEYVRSREISRLEQATTEDLLLRSGIPLPE